MGITLGKFLNDYFGVEDLKNALSDIGELTTGTKIELVKRLIAQWEPHRRDKYDLLDYLDEDMLMTFCKDYNIDSDGDENLLKRRIKRQKLLDNRSPKPSTNMIDDLTLTKKTLIEKESIPQEKKTSTEHHHLFKIAAIFGIIGTIIAILTYIGLKPH